MTTNSFNRSELGLLQDSVLTRISRVKNILRDLDASDKLLFETYSNELRELTELEIKILDLLQN